jgi:hypothetical protein
MMPYLYALETGNLDVAETVWSNDDFSINAGILISVSAFIYKPLHNEKDFLLDFGRKVYAKTSFFVK